MTRIKVVNDNDTNDIRTIERLAKDIWTRHYLPIIGREQVDYMLMKYQSFDAIKQSIREGYVYYLAYKEDEPCGYSAVKHDNGIFLSKFYVKEEYRGMGIGKAMINEIKVYAESRQSGRIWLTCNKHNSNTLSVYKKLGFEIIDSIVTDIGNGFVMDDFVLEKQLKNH